MSGRPTQEEWIAIGRKLGWGKPQERLEQGGRQLRFGGNRRISVDLTKGVYNEHGGKGGSYVQAYREAFGERPGANGANGNGTHTSTPKEEATGWTECMMPPPATATRPTAHQLECTTIYEYFNLDEKLLYYIKRTDYVSDGKRRKRITPLTYGWATDRHGRSYLGWHYLHPPVPRPLYRLNVLAQLPEATVLLCEGEKAAEAAQRLFLDHVGMAWSGGVPGADKADLTPLEGRRVIIWPDADEPGRKALGTLRKLLPKAAWISTHDLGDEGYDAADLELDHDVSDPKEWLRKRIREPTAHELLPIYWEDQRVADWAGRVVPDMEWIVPGWIPAEQLTGLYGVGGINKTDFLLQLLMAKSRGLPFIGFQLEPSPVYGLFCEDTREQIIRRIDRIALHYGLTRADFPDLHFVSLVGYDEPELMVLDQRRDDPVTEALRYVDRKVVEIGARLVTLDMGDHFFGGDELRKRDIIRFVRKLDGVSVTRKFGMVMSRHPSQRGRKEGGRQESGNSGWEGCMRARVGLDIDRTESEEGGNPYRPDPVGEGRTLILWKSNYSKAGVTLDLICKNGVFTTAALDPEKAQARGVGARDACKAKFIELLRKATEMGKSVNDSGSHPSTYAPALFASHPDGKNFSKAQYVRALQELEAEGCIKYELKNGRKRMIETTTQGG